MTGYDGAGGNFAQAHDPTVAEGDGNVFTTLNDLAKHETGLWQGVFKGHGVGSEWQL